MISIKKKCIAAYSIMRIFSFTKYLAAPSPNVMRYVVGSSASSPLTFSIKKKKKSSDKHIIRLVIAYEMQ